MVAFSPDSRLLAIAASHFGVVRIWDVTSNREVAVLRHPGVEFVGFSANGKRLVTAGPDSVRTCNLAGAREKSALSGHGGGVPGVAFSPDGKLLASTGKDRVVRLWDPVTGKMVRELSGFKGPAQSVTFSADGRFLISTGWTGGVKIWEMPSGREVVIVPPELPANLAVGSSDGGLFIWNLPSINRELSRIGLDW